jgi:nitrite reductase (NADH) small subunit
MKQVRVCKFSELSEGCGKSVKVFAREIAVFKINGTLRAMDGLCKHMKAPLVLSGRLKGTILTCQWHGWQYDVTSGACLGKPLVNLRQYEVEIRDGDIFVRVDPDPS